MRLLHIGRATSNDIVISDQTVSRQHAQLIVDDLGQATLIDLNSANGTFVNGKRISDPRRLDPTDIVKVGEYLFLWRNYLHDAPVTPPVSTPVSAPASAPAPAQEPVYASAQADAAEPAPVRKPFPWKWVGIGGGVVAVIVILLIVLNMGGTPPKLDGRWMEKEDLDTWINFGPNGKYTEGYEDEVTYDSATWKAMGIDRILIEKGALQVSRTYEFEGDDLKITQGGKSTLYRRAPEK